MLTVSTVFCRLEELNVVIVDVSAWGIIKGIWFFSGGVSHLFVMGISSMIASWARSITRKSCAEAHSRIWSRKVRICAHRKASDLQHWIFWDRQVSLLVLWPCGWQVGVVFLTVLVADLQWLFGEIGDH